MSWLDENQLFSNLLEEFKKAGVNATLLERYSTEAIGEGRIRWLSSAYDVNEAPFYAGTIKVTDRKFDQLQVFSRIVPSDVGAFRWYDSHFCLMVSPQDKSRVLFTTVDEAQMGDRFKIILGVGKKFEKFKWTGKGLAEKLNGDAELNEMLVKYGLWKFHGDLRPMGNVRVCPDEKYKCVRIVFRMDRKESKDPQTVASKTVASMEIAERIAQHIRSVIG